MAITPTESSQRNWDKLSDGTVLQFHDKHFYYMKINQEYMVEVTQETRGGWVPQGQAIEYQALWNVSTATIVYIPVEEEAAGVEPSGNFNSTIAAPIALRVFIILIVILALLWWLNP